MTDNESLTKTPSNIWEEFSEFFFNQWDQEMAESIVIDAESGDPISHNIKVIVSEFLTETKREDVSDQEKIDFVLAWSQTDAYRYW